MNRVARSLSLSSLLLLTLAGPAIAQGRRGSPPQPSAEPRPDVQSGVIETGGNGFALPAGQFTVSELIDAAAQYLGRNILWNDVELQTAFAGQYLVLQKKIVVDAIGCEELLYGLLFTKALTIVPVDEQRGCYEVVAMSGPRARDLYSRAPVRTREQVLRRPAFRELCCLTITLEHLDAGIACNALRPFLATNSNTTLALWMGTAGNQRTIMLTGFGDQVAAALRLLQEADRPQPAELELAATLQRLQGELAKLANAVTFLEARVQELEKKLAHG